MAKIDNRIIKEQTALTQRSDSSSLHRSIPLLY